MPYGRERLTYEGNSQCIERSTQDLGFRSDVETGWGIGRSVATAVIERAKSDGAE